MFLKNIKLLIKSNFLRNILILCFVILTSLFAIGYISYSRINNYVTDESREEIVEELTDYNLIYKEDGIDELINDITEEPEEDYFINLISNGTVIAENKPPDWNKFDFSSLPRKEIIYNNWYKFGYSNDVYEYLNYKINEKVFIQIGHNIDERSEFLGFIQKIFIYSFFLIIFIVLTFAIITVDRSITPIRKLTETIEDINNNNKFNLRVGLKSGDKLYDSLITNFNYMLDRIEFLINGMKDSLDSIAHDVKTPLTRFKLSAESSLLKSETGNESIIESLQICLEESDRILNMFNSILEISDASYGSMQLKKKEVRLKETIESVVNIYEYVIEDNNIKVSVNIDENITLKVDETKILRAISNLVDNAIKYNKQQEGHIIFNAYRDKDKVHLEVKDSGIGIDTSELDRIFEKLYRVDKSRTKGHGLGLSYANAIIKAHNGMIQVSSQLNVGSTFSVILPA